MFSLKHNNYTEHDLKYKMKIDMNIFSLTSCFFSETGRIPCSSLIGMWNTILNTMMLKKVWMFDYQNEKRKHRWIYINSPKKAISMLSSWAITMFLQLQTMTFTWDDLHLRYLTYNPKHCIYCMGCIH